MPTKARPSWWIPVGVLALFVAGSFLTSRPNPAWHALQNRYQRERLTERQQLERLEREKVIRECLALLSRHYDPATVQRYLAYLETLPVDEIKRRLEFGLKKEKFLSGQLVEEQPPDLTNIIIPAIIALGLFGAFLLTRPPELRFLRLPQMILVPCCLSGVYYFAKPLPGFRTYLTPSQGAQYMGDLLGFLPCVATLAILLAPNLAFYWSLLFEKLIDPTLQMRSEPDVNIVAHTRKLIDQDQLTEALLFIEKSLMTHRPDYEILLLKARLLFQFRRLPETRQALLQCLALAQNAQQQLAVLRGLEELRKARPA